MSRTTRTASMLCALALSLTVTGTTSASQSGIDWSQARYIDHTVRQGWFRVKTNAALFSGGVAIGGTQTLVPENWRTPEENVPAGPDDAQYHTLWASRCERVDPQTAVFTRTVNVPGAPSKLMASLFAQTLDDDGRAPIRALELRINGTQVLEYTTREPAEDDGADAIVGPVPNEDSRTLVDLTANGASAMKLGANTIKITAVKRKTKNARVCAGDSRWGIGGEVFAEFRADVSVTHQGSAWVPPDPGEEVTIPGTMTVVNNGPSYKILNGNVGIRVASQQIGDPEVTLTGDTGPCTSSHISSEGSAHCPYNEIPPGATHTFDIVITYTHSANDYKIFVSSNVPGYGEATFANNNFTTFICHGTPAFCAS